MSYNILNYPGNDPTTRNPYFRTVLSSVNPDIIVLQEMTSQGGVNGFLSNIMNTLVKIILQEYL
jgi:endonuclease/exonuclease/phosphatase family metal-dependent hydrolase